MEVIFLRGAEADLLAAWMRYEEILPGLGGRFEAEVRQNPDYRTGRGLPRQPGLAGGMKSPPAVDGSVILPMMQAEVCELLWPYGRA